MHIPVLKKEVLEYLDPRPNQNFIDATIDGGGHALAILEKIAPHGKLLGIDRDEKMVEQLKFQVSGSLPAEATPQALQAGRFQDNLLLVCDNFDNLKEIAAREKFGQVQGILFDLGMSTWHLKESGKGFSFQRDEELDMRYSVENSKQSNAKEIVNKWSEKKIRQILKDYGEERFNKEIAKEIIEARKRHLIATTFQLVDIIEKAVPAWYRQQKIHAATKTFQALRIAVNDELGSLQRVLPQALEVLDVGARLVIISFHSLEDRIVKIFFKENKIKILTKKPVRPSKQELAENPNSRSAKLRAGMKL